MSAGTEPGNLRAGLTEPLVTFVAATALASALFWLGQAVPFVHANKHGAIALVFLYAPRAASRVSGRPFDYWEAGLRLEPVGLSLRTLGSAIVVTWPLFFGAFLLFYGASCSPGEPSWFARLMEPFAPTCGRWQGWGGAQPRLPPEFWLIALAQVVVVAIPEELFFRGYLYARLEARWPSRRRLWGAPVGLTLPVSSALFALGHVLVDFDPQRLVVFLPGLVFGWMRARTGAIAAGALFHALCNLFSEVLYASFFG